MTNLDAIKSRWAEYNTGVHPADWHIDRGLALAQDVGALLAVIERQQAVIDAAGEVDDRSFTLVNVFIDSVNWSHEHYNEARQILITPEQRHSAARAIDNLHDALVALKDAADA